MSQSGQQNLNRMHKAQSDMGSLFSGFFNTIESLKVEGNQTRNHNVDDTITSVSSNMWTPKVEKEVTDATLVVRARFPNTSDKVRLDISTPGKLRIYGESSEQVSYNSGDDHITEKRLGQFEKDIPLPPNAMIENMMTALDGSTIVITIPRRQ